MYSYHIKNINLKNKFNLIKGLLLIIDVNCVVILLKKFINN